MLNMEKNHSEFGQFTFIHRCTQRLQFNLTEKKSTRLDANFMYVFACGKSLTVVFNFEHAVRYSGTEDLLYLTLTAKCCLAHAQSFCCASAIGDACICSFAISCRSCSASYTNTHKHR